ncbi:MAG: KH domain-containing protein [bacterium]
MAKEADQEFLEFVVKGIVDNPKDVHIERTIDEMGVLLTLKVNSADMGQLIGRQGATAKAIRTLLRIIGIKNNARVNLKIIEPEGGRAPAPRPASQVEPEAKAKNVDQVVDELKL